MSFGNPNTPAGDRSVLYVKLKSPRLHEDVLLRDDLLARLDGGLTRRLTLISAPTGFGKTTLIGSWISSRGLNSAWVALDEYDNDPSRFWTYIVSALRTFDSTLGKSTLSFLMAPQSLTPHILLSPLINDLTRLSGPHVLILEDYHSITSKEVGAGISFLLQHLPDSLHLVLTTRAEPDLPLPILRARDELIEIDAAGLRFTQAETEAFLQRVMRTELPTAAVMELFQKTEGWAAGLRLATLALQHKDNAADAEAFIRSFSGGDRFIADYLIKEVFENQPEATRAFLLRTCFFRRLSASLCDAITETLNSAATLQQLERDNLFTMQFEHRSGQTWYRYHPLFAESIQQISRRQLGEADIKQLFTRAGDWYEHHGLYDEAIEALLGAGLFARALASIEEFIEIHDISETHTLGRWLENIPQQDILRHPVICFTYAQITLYTTDRFAPQTLIRIEPFLRAAESAWRTEENHQRLGELLSFRGIAVWWQGKFQKAFELARQSLALLPESSVFWRGNSLLLACHEALSAGQISVAQGIILEARALLGAAQNAFGVLAANQVLAEILYWQGSFEQAEQLNRQILAEAVGDESMLDDQGIASLSLAHIFYEQNKLEQAEHFARRALDLAEQRANEMLQVQTMIRLAQIYAAKGDSVRARNSVNSLASRIHHQSLFREMQNTQALLTIRVGDISGLDWWIKIASSEDQPISHLQAEQEAFILARIKIASGKAYEALASLRKWKTDAKQNGRTRSQIEALCLEAMAHHAGSNMQPVTKLLSEALALGQARGFQRIFLDEGTRMAALLQVILPSLPNRTLGLFATTLLRSFSPEIIANLAATMSAVQIEPLSPQELRVLRLLSTGLSNMEIARELVVSTNTIKTQVKSIYRKLNVKSRDEARAVARELSLI